MPEFIKSVSSQRPGDVIRIEFLRNGRKRETTAKLKSREEMPRYHFNPGQFYPQGGKLSKNRTGYPRVLQHDMPITPQQCGGPVVDLDGRILGINIARAGRTKTYAIPSNDVKRLLSEALKSDA